MKNIKLFFYILLVTVFFSCDSNSKKPPKTASIEMNEKLQTLLNQYYEEKLKLYPLSATALGDNRYNDTLPNNLTQDFREKTKLFYEQYQQKLHEFDKSTLSDNDQMNYDVLDWECNINLEALQFPTELTPIDQFWTLQLIMGQYAGGTSAQPFETPEDYQNWLERLQDFTVWCDTAVANMKKGITANWVLPKVLTEKVITQLGSLDHGPVEQHLFYTPVHLIPASFDDSTKTHIARAYHKMVEDEIIPTFKKMHDFMQNEYLSASRATAGAYDLPNGKAYYNFRIKEYTTTEKSADEIFELGKSEVDRILIEMEKVKDEVGFDGDMKAFFNHVRNKKELMPYDSAEQVIAHFQDIYNTIQPNLKKLFDLTPKTPFEIRRTEAFREASASAEYASGSVDGSRPGIFYVPVPDAPHYNVFSDESLFLHEAIPGHHYQISLQQESADLPQFRKSLWYSAYGEGWALYCESLGKELGLYTDPYQYFGMLSAEMHRAIRLVVDAGMHAKGWTREEAIQYSLDHEAEPKASIIAEVERYMAMPGQALSYKIGQLKIKELRAKAEKELGSDFDIKAFHNQVLESGCLPLELLEQKIDHWIRVQKEK